MKETSQSVASPQKGVSSRKLVVASTVAVKVMRQRVIIVTKLIIFSAFAKLSRLEVCQNYNGVKIAVTGTIVVYQHLTLQSVRNYIVYH